MPFIRLTKLKRSFVYAGRGLVYAIRNEQNFRIQLVIGLLVIIGMLVWDLPLWQDLMLLVVIGAVLILEMVNTIFEKIADILQPRIHSYVAIIKDLMAAAVLLVSIGAVVIGVLIFWPYLVALW